jgi:protocatechuate 3,4-dioxygenase beta subunit
VYDVDGGRCVPIKGATVDVWHASASGLYSDIPSIGTEGKKYLRGYQITDGNGTVRFTTIYPGWYEGRSLHIHFKVRTFEGSTKTLEFTSQLYLDDAISDQIQTQYPYNNHGPRPLKNPDDSIFTGPSTDGMVQKDTGHHLMLQLTKNATEYVGTFNVGLKRTMS